MPFGYKFFMGVGAITSITSLAATQTSLEEAQLSLATFMGFIGFGVTVVLPILWYIGRYFGALDQRLINIEKSLKVAESFESRLDDMHNRISILEIKGNRR